MTAGLATTNCPVCQRPQADAVRCGHCRWILSAGPWVGEATAAHRQAFADELAAARHEFDLAAAVLAAGFPHAGDAAVLDRLAGLIRGRRPGDTELAAARARASRGIAAGSVPSVAGPAMARLVTGNRTLTLVEVTTTGIALVRLETDEAGVPRAHAPVRRLSWPELLPALPADDDECLLVLAGGVGTGAPARITDTDLTALVANPAAFPAAGDGDVLLLHGLRGWAVPDRLVRLAEPVTGPPVPVSGGPSLDDALVAELIAAAPLRFGYGLVLIEQGQDGATRPVLHPLFPAGATAMGRHSLVTVPVVAPVNSGKPVVLAVVGGHAGTEPRQCRPICVIRIHLPAGEPRTLEFSLAGPGRVELHRPEGGRPDPDAVSGWPRLLDGIPPIYRPQGDALDLVFTVELGGTADEVDRRVGVIANVLRLIEDRHPALDSVRVGVIGYEDHQRRKRNVLHVHPLGPLADAAKFVAGVTATRQIEPRAAPLEDALRAATGLPWRSPPTACRLVIVGSRPPHPKEDGKVARCPNRYGWRAELEWLNRNEVHRIAVWDQPSWSERPNEEGRQATSTWQTLGRTVRVRGPLLLDGIDPALVATRADALGPAKPAPPLLFPLTTDRPVQESTR